MRKNFIYAAGLFVAFMAGGAVGAPAQTGHPTVFLEAKEELAKDFSTALIRKKIPVTLTTDLEHSSYVARVTVATKKGSKTLGVVTAVILGAYISGAYTRVSISVIERESNNVIYHDTCEMGGRHLQPFADCLAKHWKKSLKGDKTKMRVFADVNTEGI